MPAKGSANPRNDKTYKKLDRIRHQPLKQHFNLDKKDYFAGEIIHFKEMKISALSGNIFLLLFLFCTTSSSHGQEARKGSLKSGPKIKKHTVLEQYESDLVLSAEDRLQLKKERIATIKKRKGIIDTLDISERQRRRLLKELYRTPFSDRWEKVIAEIEFEDEEY